MRYLIVLALLVLPFAAFAGDNSDTAAVVIDVNEALFVNIVDETITVEVGLDSGTGNTLSGEQAFTYDYGSTVDATITADVSDLDAASLGTWTCDLDDTDIDAGTQVDGAGGTLSVADVPWQEAADDIDVGDLTLTITAD